MPVHTREDPKGSLKVDDSEVFKWVEERLESIGLDGKLYSRVIKSVLKSNLDEEEFELKMEHKKLPCNDLLINEILLASMWKGNDKTDDYWIFKEVITDFVHRYKSKDALDPSDVASSNESDASEERYEEAFPSLSNACDEIAWNIPKWKCDVQPLLVKSFLGSQLHLPCCDNNESIYEIENRFIRMKLQEMGRRQRRRTKALSSMRWKKGNDKSIAGLNTKRWCSVAYKDKNPRISKSSMRKLIGEFSHSIPSHTRNDGSMKKLYTPRMTTLSDEGGSTSSHVSSNDDTFKRFETFGSVSLKLLFSNLNNNPQSHPRATDVTSSDCLQSGINSALLESSKACSSSNEDLIICDLLTLPFFPEQLFTSNDPTARSLWLNSFIPDHPWSSRTFEDSNDLNPAKNTMCDENDDKCRLKAKNCPQSPLPYFHPDPPSYIYPEELNSLASIQRTVGIKLPGTAKGWLFSFHHMRVFSVSGMGASFWYRVNSACALSTSSYLSTKDSEPESLCNSQFLFL